MKRFIRTISFLLIFVFLFQIAAQPVSAIGYNSREIEYNFVINEEDININQVFEDLSPEAKQIFLEYMLKENKEMLDYHKKYVGNINTNVLIESKAYELQSSVAVNAGLVLKTLNYKLNALNLGADVVYALMGVASSMLSSIASLGAGTIFSILVAAGASAVIIANWSSISGKWDKVIRAFQESFTSVSSSTIASGFNQAKTSHAKVYNDMMAIDYMVKSAPMTTSVAKHIERDFVDRMRKKSPSEIYYSPVSKKVLLKYKVDRGIKTDLNVEWYKNGPQNNGKYDKQNYDVSGATLFILFDFNNRQVFHAHLRLASSRFVTSETEQMRYYNKLSWKVKPFPMLYQPQYDKGGGSGQFSGTQLD